MSLEKSARALAGPAPCESVGGIPDAGPSRRRNGAPSSSSLRAHEIWENGDVIWESIIFIYTSIYKICMYAFIYLLIYSFIHLFNLCIMMIWDIL